ncbi:hypothetical protein DFH07DRAFT_878689 [Mycena maculata]|uniref:Transmembrane protein n=1 Tax=Mycena maculata TaxID=230809 RepID=A0AAD7NRI4_9AGAR|nr:hypothetical protein DFH07DRAFT_878689 [Mycena maculata]
MIIDPQLDQGSSKQVAVGPSPTLRLPEPVAGRSTSPLPDYETSQAQHSVIFRKPSFPHRFDSRFWRLTFFALAIYVFLSVVIGIPLIVTRITYQKSHPPPNIVNLFLDESSDQVAPPYVPMGMGGMVMAESTITCDAWNSMDMAGELYQATASGFLAPSGVFSVRSNATDEVVPHPGGMHNLTVDINTDASQTQVVMYVTLTASSAALRAQAHFCFSTTGADRGVSVYIPQYLSATDVLAFDIRLLFPQSPDPIIISDLITYLPMFSQWFGSLVSSRVSVQNINIAGAGLDIICDYLQADKIVVQTSFASISGTFNVTQSLKLDNIEGSINTNTTLVNNPSSGLPTFLALDTGNSDILANVVMVAPSNSRPPMYRAHVKTFNGSLALKVAHDAATQPASLDLHVENNQAQSTVSLDAKYMGLFDVHTKLAPVQVVYDQVVPDPTGQGRQWQLDIDSNSTSWMRGWVGFGTRPAYYNPSMSGKVSVVSSLSPILLELGQGS